ncbi:MAG: thioredoxin domain-containing protein [Acidimicrobiales bacterium]
MPRQITIQHTPGCPNAPLARQRVEAAIGQLDGAAPVVATQQIADPGDATRRGFRGSPTILFDGVDRFATSAGAPAFACRIYATESGPEGAPSVRQILEVLTNGRED